MTAAVLNPQVWEPPALTDWNVPAGGADWPTAFQPQQAIVSSLLIAQVWVVWNSGSFLLWKPPALTAWNVPPGEVAWRTGFQPQQAIVSSLLIAQMWEPPALTER
jgi:hypothetical protein